MRVHAVVRDVVLLGVAVAVGWWMRGGGTPVLASGAGSDGNLAFQVSGMGPDTALTVYNTNNRTLYVYPRIQQGNSHISCGYSFAMTSPGAPMERQNCGVGEQVR
jgi:hypothetical protein